MLNEFVYCPRLFFYEWVEGLFAESADTVEGKLQHSRVDQRPDALPPPEQACEEPIHSRSVTLSSQRHGLIARIDRIPPPLVDSPKCPKCSLVGICLPDETHALTAQLVRLPELGP